MAANTTVQELSAVPYRSTKVIQLIRHGKGFHNDLPNQQMYKSWDYFDAHLTDLTLETAAGCFGGLSLDGPQASHTDGGNHNGNTTNGTGNGRSGVFMNGTEAEASKSVKQASILLPDVPVVAHELCRETLGVHPCDKRRPVVELKQQFPGVDFSLVEHDEDPLWIEDKRETLLEIRERAYGFARWLMMRPEKHIAVVAHSGFLFAFCQNFGHGLGDAVTGFLHPHFANGEMRTLILTDTSGKLTPDLTHDPLHFPGGNHVLQMQES